MVDLILDYPAVPDQSGLGVIGLNESIVMEEGLDESVLISHEGEVVAIVGRWRSVSQVVKV